VRRRGREARQGVGVEWMADANNLFEIYFEMDRNVFGFWQRNDDEECNRMEAMLQHSTSALKQIYV
jgi:hypothetical protein